MEMERTPRRTHPSSHMNNYGNYQNIVSASPSRHTPTPFLGENGGLPVVIDASSWKKGKTVQEPGDSRNQQPRQVGAERERMKDMMADSFSRNETISILPGFKETRTIAKPCIKLASSSSFSHRNSVKAEKPPVGYSPQAWKSQENTAQMRQQQYYQQPRSSSPPNKSEKAPMQHPKGHEIRGVRGAGDSDSTPWPYSKGQKSQRAIREAQAAYKRDLDRQIEEKRLTIQKGDARPTNNQKDPETPRAINQSVSLEAFRNTGFLPPWFDPIRNNPLCNQGDPKEVNAPAASDNEPDSSETMSNDNRRTGPPKEIPSMPQNTCPMDFQQPSQTMYAPCPPTMTNLEGNYYIVTQDVLNQLNQGSLQLQNLQMFPSYSPSPSHHASPSQSQSKQVIISSNEIPVQSKASQQQEYFHPQGIQHLPPPGIQHQPPQGIQHQPPQGSQHQPPQGSQHQPPPGTQHQPQVTSQQQQSAAPMQSIHMSQIQQPVSCGPQLQQPYQQNWSPWLNPTSNNYSINLHNLPPPPTPPHMDSHYSQISPRAENLHPLPHIPIGEPVFVGQGDEPGIQQIEASVISSKEDVTESEAACESRMKDDTSFENTNADVDGDSRVNTMPHVSQTSNQRPNEEHLRIRYKSELAKQIEEKKRIEQEKAARQEEEDMKLQKKLEEDQRRMIEEYEKEQVLEKIKQDEYKKRQEIILKEKERFDRAAEEERVKKKIERRKSQAAMVTPRKDAISEDKPHAYESPIDRTVCAASKWKPVERAKSPVKSECSGDQIPDSPRPRTVVISQHRPVIVDHDSPRHNLPLSEPTPTHSTISFDDDGKLQHDISFLAHVKKAIIAEDNRIESIINKKERFFVTI